MGARASAFRDAVEDDATRNAVVDLVSYLDDFTLVLPRAAAQLRRNFLRTACRSVCPQCPSPTSGRPGPFPMDSALVVDAFLSGYRNKVANPAARIPQPRESHFFQKKGQRQMVMLFKCFHISGENPAQRF